MEYFTKREKNKTEDVGASLVRLLSYMNKGITISVDGKECTDEDLLTVLNVNENGGSYMGDYVYSDTGKLTGVNFINVSRKESGISDDITREGKGPFSHIYGS